MPAMATVVRDPRDIVTPDAFRVADHLIGTPLAKPVRRLGAILIDLLLVAILVALLDAIGLLIALVGAFFVFRLSRGGTGRWYRRFYRRGLGCFGAILVFIATLVVFDLVTDNEGDDPQFFEGSVTADTGTIEIEGLGGIATLMTLRDGNALRNATRPGERDTLAARIVERIVAEGRISPAGLRAAVADLAESDVMPGPAIAALEAAVETTTARMESRAPRSAADIRSADSIAAAAAAASAAVAAVDSGAPVDSALFAARDSLETLNAELRETRATLAQEREELTTSRERLDAGAFRWLMSSVADELGLGLGWLGLYFTAFTVLGRGQTPGKRLFRLRVIRLDGKAIGWWLSLQRFGGYSASVFTGMLGFAEMFWDDNRQALQDKLTHTVVIQEGKRAQAGPPASEHAVPLPAAPSEDVDPADGSEIASEDGAGFEPAARAQAPERAGTGYEVPDPADEGRRT